MRIDIDETWAVVSDQYQFKLCRKSITQSGKGEGQEVLTCVGFYTSISAAFRQIPAHALKRSEAHGIPALIEQMMAMMADWGARYDRQRLKGKAA